MTDLIFMCFLLSPDLHVALTCPPASDMKDYTGRIQCLAAFRVREWRIIRILSVAMTL